MGVTPSAGAVGTIACAAVVLAAGCYEAHEPPRCTQAAEGTTAGGGWPEGVTVAPVGAGIVLDAEGPGGPPHVAWDGAAWNVAWGGAIAVLDEDGGLRALERRQDGGEDANGLEPGGCLRSVTSAAPSPGTSLVAWFGGDGVVDGALEVPGTDADVARGEARWWIVSDTSAARDVGGQLTVLDAVDGPAPRARTRATIVGSVVGSPRIIGWEERAVVSWVDRDGVVQRAVDAHGEGASWRVMTANVWSRGALESTRYQGPGGEPRVIVAATDGVQAHVAITDPIGRRVIAGPVAVTRTEARGARPAIAPMPERRTIAVCVPSGPRPWGGADVIDRVDVVLLGDDAAPLARASSIHVGAGVTAASCAWNGRELLVVWWRRGEGERMAARRARVVVTGGEPVLF